MSANSAGDFPSRHRSRLLAWWRGLNPSQIFIGSFLALILPPDPDDTLDYTDTLIIAGTGVAIERLAEMASATAEDGE